MSRLITLSFPQTNTTLFATTISGVGATASINLNYPLIFPNFERTLTLTSAGNNSGTTFTIHGTNIYGVPITETFAGPNANTVTSALQYSTITSIGTSGNYTNLSIGSGSTGTSQWIKVNTFNTYPSITIATETLGTINYTINQTIENLEYYKDISSNLGAGSTLQYFINTAPESNSINGLLTNATANQIYTLTTPTTALQVIINSSTAGSLTVNILQQGVN